MRRRALGAAAALLALAGTVGIARSTTAVRALSRLPGLVGRFALAALVRRGDEPGTRRALGLLADGSAEPAARAAVACAFGELRETSALPAIVSALNGGPPQVASACSRALRAFEGRGRSFEADDPPEQCAAVVREWNAWWRLRESALLGGGREGSPAGGSGGGFVAPLGAPR